MSRKRKDVLEGFRSRSDDAEEGNLNEHVPIVSRPDYGGDDGGEAGSGTMPAAESNGVPRPRWNPVQFWLCEIGDDGLPVRVLGQCRSLRAGTAKVDEYARVLGTAASRVVVYRVRVGYPLPPRPEVQ